MSQGTCSFELFCKKQYYDQSTCVKGFCWEPEQTLYHQQRIENREKLGLRSWGSGKTQIMAID